MKCFFVTVSSLLYEVLLSTPWLQATCRAGRWYVHNFTLAFNCLGYCLVYVLVPSQGIDGLRLDTRYAAIIRYFQYLACVLDRCHADSKAFLACLSSMYRS